MRGDPPKENHSFIFSESIPIPHEGNRCFFRILFIEKGKIILCCFPECRTYIHRSGSSIEVHDVSQ